MAEILHAIVVVVEELAGDAVGDEEAYGEDVVAQQTAKTVDCGALHLHVGDGIAAVLECFNLLVKFGDDTGKRDFFDCIFHYSATSPES